MKEITDKLPSNKQPAEPAANEIPVEDDRFPGSFFKVTQIPRPGKTGWNIAKFK